MKVYWSRCYIFIQKNNRLIMLPVIVLTLLLSNIYLKAQVIAIGGPGNDYGVDIELTSDGGYVIAGYTNSFGQGGYDVYVVKLDAGGNIQWTRTIGGIRNDYGISVTQTVDGGFAVGGFTYSFCNTGCPTYSDFYIIKLDPAGNVQWTRTVGGAYEERGGYSILQTSDGGIVTAGMTHTFCVGGCPTYRDHYIIKLDSNGNLLWTRAIGGSSYEWGTGVIQTKDGGFAICGGTTSFGPGFENIYLVKLSATANLQWARAIGGGSNNRCPAVIQTSDGGYALVGMTNTYGQGSWDVYVIKLDASGNIQWTRTVGGTDWDYGRRIVQTADGGYIVLGATRSFGQNPGVSFDVYLIRLDANGNLLWTKTIGGTGDDRGNDIILTSDGGYVIVGVTNSFGQGGYDILLLKLDSSGNINMGMCGAVSSGGIPGSGVQVGTGGSTVSGGLVSMGGLVDSGGVLTTCTPFSLYQFILDAERVGEDNNSVLLRWKLTSDAYPEKWIIERSCQSADNFRVLAILSAEQATIGPGVPVEGKWIDENVCNSEYVLYRVVAYLSNGEKIYSNTVKIIPYRSGLYSLTIYPDGNMLRVKLNNQLIALLRISIYSLEGRLIRSSLVHPTSEMVEINIGDLTSGSYLVEVRDELTGEPVIVRVKLIK